MVFCADGGAISINGKLSFLTLQKSKQHAQHPPHETVGDSYVDVWQGANATVTLRYRITFICPPDDESCEVTRYEGTMLVTVGKETRLYHVWGDFGA
jgi:hypothetical protein